MLFAQEAGAGAREKERDTDHSTSLDINLVTEVRDSRLDQPSFNCLLLLWMAAPVLVVECMLETSEHF